MNDAKSNEGLSFIRVEVDKDNVAEPFTSCVAASWIKLKEVLSITNLFGGTFRKNIHSFIDIFHYCVPTVEQLKKRHERFEKINK